MPSCCAPSRSVVSYTWNGRAVWLVTWALISGRCWDRSPSWFRGDRPAGEGWCRRRGLCGDDVVAGRGVVPDNKKTPRGCGRSARLRCAGALLDNEVERVKVCHEPHHATRPGRACTLVHGPCGMGAPTARSVRRGGGATR